MNFRRYYIPGSAVFITQVIQDRIPVFRDPENVNLFKHGLVKDPRAWINSSYIGWEKRGLYPPAFCWEEPQDIDWGE